MEKAVSCGGERLKCPRCCECYDEQECVRCFVCKSAYHPSCNQVPPDVVVEVRHGHIWKCPLCRVHAPHTDDSVDSPTNREHSVGYQMAELTLIVNELKNSVDELTKEFSLLKKGLNKN